MKLYTLKKNSEFQRVFRTGKSVANRYLVVYALVKGNGNEEKGKIGFAVSKKVGKAVQRNRVKRLLREITRINFKYIKNDYDLVLVARPQIINADYHELEKNYLNLLGKLHLLK